MDLKAILKARNLSDEQIEALITKPEYSGLLESFVQEAEQGKTALQKAQEIEDNLKKWNENEVVPYVRKADEKVAATAGKLAQMTAHMKALKEAGYDIPDAYLEASVEVEKKAEPVTSHTGISAEDIDKRAMDIAKTNMALVTLSNRHRKLTGDELDLDSEYTDFEANRRPKENLREYIARKYDHAGKESALKAAAEQKKLDEYAENKLKEAKAKWALENGANGETRNPRASRFDTIVADTNRAALHNTRQGREQATKNRLEKYTALVTQ